MPFYFKIVLNYIYVIKYINQVLIYFYDKKNSFKYEDLIECANGKLFGPGNAKLPSPPMLMFNRITNIEDNKGKYSKGIIEAELDIKEKLRFFDCHFKEDPVMPGCLGLDAMWQLVGFYLGWIGEPGKGRALGVNTVKFTSLSMTRFFLFKKPCYFFFEVKNDFYHKN